MDSLFCLCVHRPQPQQIITPCWIPGVWPVFSMMEPAKYYYEYKKLHAVFWKNEADIHACICVLRHPREKLFQPWT
jgi:hypothetical protein